MRLVALFVACLFSSPAWAQDSSFVPGYVVVDGDTLNGQIAVGTEVQASRGARFRAAGSGTERAISVTDATAFGERGGRAYRRGRFATAPPLEGVPMPRLAFARVARDGAADLLVAEATSGTLAFAFTVEGETTPLYVFERTVDGPSGNRLQRVEQYRQVLLVRLGGCGVTEASVADTQLTEASLAEVIDQYNRCQDSEYATTRASAAPQRRPSDWSVEVGVGLATSQFERAIQVSVEDPDQSSSSLALAVEVSPGVLPASVSFLVGAEYDRGLIRVTIANGFSPRRVDRLDAGLLVLGARWTVPVAGTPLFVGAGFVNGRTFRQTVRENESGEPLDETTIRTSVSGFLTSLGGATPNWVCARSPVGLGLRPGTARPCSPRASSTCRAARAAATRSERCPARSRLAFSDGAPPGGSEWGAPDAPPRCRGGRSRA